MGQALRNGVRHSLGLLPGDMFVQSRRHAPIAEDTLEGVAGVTSAKDMRPPEFAKIVPARKLKFRGHNPNDGIEMFTTSPVNRANRPSHHVWITTEIPLPKAVAHYQNLVIAGLTLPRQESPPFDRLCCQQREKVGGHLRTVDCLRKLITRHQQMRSCKRTHILEQVFLLL